MLERGIVWRWGRSGGACRVGVEIFHDLGRLASGGVCKSKWESGKRSMMWRTTGSVCLQTLGVEGSY